MSPTHSPVAYSTNLSQPSRLQHKETVTHPHPTPVTLPFLVVQSLQVDLGVVEMTQPKQDARYSALQHTSPL